MPDDSERFDSSVAVLGSKASHLERVQVEVAKKKMDSELFDNHPSKGS